MEPRRPLRVGLTGGIASGKTTVAAVFRELGALVLDADALAHAVMRPGGTAYHDVVERFGPEILDPDGRIRRADLARRVFADPEELRALNRIVHPRVMEEAERRIRRELDHRPGALIVFDAALLVETGLHRGFDALVVVSCSRDAQLQRLLARGMQPRDALARIEAQAPLEEKLAVADHVIDTEGTLKQTRRCTEEVYAALLADQVRRGDAASPPA